MVVGADRVDAGDDHAGKPIDRPRIRVNLVAHRLAVGIDDQLVALDERDTFTNRSRALARCDNAKAT